LHLCCTDPQDVLWGWKPTYMCMCRCFRAQHSTARVRVRYKCIPLLCEDCKRLCAITCLLSASWCTAQSLPVIQAVCLHAEKALDTAAPACRHSGQQPSSSGLQAGRSAAPTCMQSKMCPSTVTVAEIVTFTAMHRINPRRSKQSR
jgi:hypothetical protein